jgi:peptide chain release factor 3
VHRLAGEFAASVRLDRLPYGLARRTRAQDVDVLGAQRGVEVLSRGDGALLALFPDQWRLASVQRDFPDLVLTPLVAAAD